MNNYKAFFKRKIKYFDRITKHFIILSISITFFNEILNDGKIN